MRPRKPNWWHDALMFRLERGPATAEEIGSILQAHGPDAVCRVRQSGIPLVVVGNFVGPKGMKRNLYGYEAPRDNPENDLDGATA